MMQRESLRSPLNKWLWDNAPADKSILSQFCCCHCIPVCFFEAPMFKRAAAKVNEHGDADITLQMCRSVTGYFFPCCKRTKWLWTRLHLISCTKSLGKVKAACVCKVHNLWLSGSSACRAGRMVITELSLCPVPLLIKGWAEQLLCSLFPSWEKKITSDKWL